MARPTGLSDKEVGELWRVSNGALDNPGVLALWPKAVRDLIRKLVEQRAAHNRGRSFNEILRTDFGIDPETFTDG